LSDLFLTYVVGVISSLSAIGIIAVARARSTARNGRAEEGQISFWSLLVTAILAVVPLAVSIFVFFYFRNTDDFSGMIRVSWIMAYAELIAWAGFIGGGVGMVGGYLVNLFCSFLSLTFRLPEWLTEGAVPLMTLPLLFFMPAIVFMDHGLGFYFFVTATLIWGGGVGGLLGWYFNI
jgi:hypothetical protein